MRLKISCLICLLMFTVRGANAQVNFATYVNLSQKIITARKQHGETAIHTEKDRFTIYAVFQNGLVGTLYAIDLKGNRINGIISKMKQGCEVSFRSRTDGKLLCYDITCNLLSIPPKPAASKP